MSGLVNAGKHLMLSGFSGAATHISLHTGNPARARDSGH
jgi:hypothetical protein